MKEGIRDTVVAQLKVLENLRKKIPLSDASYYRGKALIAWEFANAGLRPELMALLRQIPVKYFEKDFPLQAGVDEILRKKAEDMAFMVVGFSETQETVSKGN